MARLRKQLVGPAIVLVVLTVVVAFAAHAIGGWVQSVGPLVVLGVGMLWGRVLRERRLREDREGE